MSVQPESTNTAHPMSDNTSLLISEDMLAVDQLIRKSLHTDIALVGQIAEYIITSGGKRIRPILHILAAKACGYSGDKHIQLAAIIEFIHTATLLHDDVVDESERRRGRQTAHTVWGNPASVLVGDFLYSRSFEMMVNVDSMQVMSILARATNVIAEGEVHQLMHLGNPELDEAQYQRVIEDKTARLFRAATELAAVLTDQSDGVRNAMARFGTLLGVAFQIMDDVLDYSADQQQLGKSLGDDLAEGKATLPLIYARMAATPEQRDQLDAIIRSSVEKPNEQLQAQQLDLVHTILHATGALKLAHAKAERVAGQAIEQLHCLPDSTYKAALIDNCRYAVERQF